MEDIQIVLPNYDITLVTHEASEGDTAVLYDSEVPVVTISKLIRFTDVPTDWVTAAADCFTAVVDKIGDTVTRTIDSSNSVTYTGTRGQDITLPVFDYTGRASTSSTTDNTDSTEPTGIDTAWLDDANEWVNTWLGGDSNGLLASVGSAVDTFNDFITTVNEDFSNLPENAFGTVDSLNADPYILERLYTLDEDLLGPFETYENSTWTWSSLWHQVAGIRTNTKEVLEEKVATTDDVKALYTTTLLAGVENDQWAEDNTEHIDLQSKVNSFLTGTTSDPKNELYEKEKNADQDSREGSEIDDAKPKQLKRLTKELDAGDSAMTAGRKKGLQSLTEDKATLPAGYSIKRRKLNTIEQVFEYTNPAEDPYVYTYIHPIYQDIERFADIFTKMYNSPKLHNANAWVATYQYANGEQGTVDFTIDGIEVPDMKKAVSEVRYGPTGLSVLVQPTGRQTNVFNIKMLLKADLSNFFKLASEAGFGYMQDDAYNMNFIVSKQIPEGFENRTLRVAMKSNSWVNRIGVGNYSEPVGYDTTTSDDDTSTYDIVTHPHPELYKPILPVWVFEHFTIRAIKFPMEFDFTSRKAAEVTLVCTATKVYPTAGSLD